MRILFWSALWLTVSLSMFIGAAQYIAFGTPFTVWAILSTFASGYTMCWAFWNLSEKGI